MKHYYVIKCGEDNWWNGHDFHDLLHYAARWASLRAASKTLTALGRKYPNDELYLQKVKHYGKDKA